VVIALKGEGDKKLDPYIKRGINFVLSKAKEEGAIGEDVKHINYTTALSMVAMADYPDPKVKRVIEKARNFLLSLQHRPSLTIKDVWVGGFGYKKGARPDLSNTMFALMALKKTGGVDPEALQRALKFVQRCQNSPYNDQPWSSNDGGFIYLPGSSLAGGTKSYGSMTFSGLLCFAYLDLPREDPRVKYAFQWISEHYTLEENPGMGKQGLYYYYFVLSRALSAYGVKVIKDKNGKEHYWAKELVEKLLSLQRRDGSWVNEETRFWEGNPALCTAYCLMALQSAGRFLK